MTYTKSSPISKPSDVTAKELAYAFRDITPMDQQKNMERAVKEIVSDAKATGIDPLVAGAIGWVETGYDDQGLPFRHPNWIDEYNFGNLGKTGTPSQDAASQKWTTPEDGAKATMAHLVAYNYGKKWRNAWDADKMGDPKIIDKRFDLAVNNTPDKNGVATIGELNGRWAIDRDNNYGGKLAERANKLEAKIKKYRADNSTTPGGPTMPTRDPWDIIRPYLIEAYVEKTGPGYGYSAGNRTIVALTEHETQGEGSGEWYEAFFECPNGERCEDALVDFLVPQRKRAIYMFNNPYTDNRIPYASGGDPSAITQLAVKASRRMGNPYGGVNAFYSAVEIVKRRGAPMDTDQIEMVARLLAFTWAMRGYPLNDCMYPDEFGNEVKTSVNHSDLYTSTNCRINDGDRVAFESMALTIYGEWLGGTVPTEPTTPTEPVYAPAAIIPALSPYMDADPGGVPAIILAGGSEWIFVNDRVTVARATTPRLQRADPNALRVGKDLTKGETFTGKFLVKASAGDWYYLTAMFTRVQQRHTARLSDNP